MLIGVVVVIGVRGVDVPAVGVPVIGVLVFDWAEDDLIDNLVMAIPVMAIPVVAIPVMTSTIPGILILVLAPWRSRPLRGTFDVVRFGRHLGRWQRLKHVGSADLWRGGVAVLSANRAVIVRAVRLDVIHRACNLISPDDIWVRARALPVGLFAWPA